MRSFILCCALGAVACWAPSPRDRSVTLLVPMRARQPIINGTLDSGDPSVVEILYITGQSGAHCTGELVGPRSVLTAGHCTDVMAGGELSGPGGPALQPCTTTQDALAVAHGQTVAACNIGVFVLYNNTCTTNDANSSCEVNLLQNGNFIVGDRMVNPGFNAAQHNNTNDIGLIHLASTTMDNGQAQPGLLTFNRTNLGPACTTLGPSSLWVLEGRPQRGEFLG